jgi:hypothetical protein
MTTHSPYASDAEIEAIGEGFLARTLEKPRWTHAAHFAATAFLILRRPDIVPERDMPELIRSYNLSVGGENTDTAGYHETINQASIAAARDFLASLPEGISLAEAVNRMVAGPLGDKAWLETYWSRERMFSVKSRREWVGPDLAPLPFQVG